MSTSRKHRIFGNVWGNFMGYANEIHFNNLGVEMWKINDDKYLLVVVEIGSSNYRRENVKYFELKSEMIDFVNMYINGELNNDAQETCNLLEAMGV